MTGARSPVAARRRSPSYDVGMSVTGPAAVPGPTGVPGPRRVVIVDDHELLRTGTRRIFEDAPGYEVVGEAADGEAALAVIDATAPHVALVDIRLPTMNGIELARLIGERHPGVVVIVLSAYDDPDYVRAAVAAGVAGYLLKTTPGRALVEAIDRICAGARLLDPSLRAGFDAPGGTGEVPPSPLTARERDVVALAAQGLANKAIARELGISPRTVEGHLNHVFDKLGTTSRTELVRLALTTGLVGGEPTGPR